MSTELIPEEVSRFILDNIESVAQLEALILLRSNPDRHWSIEELAGRLYISEKQTAEVLALLGSQGFARVNSGEPPRYFYQPDSASLKSIADQLSAVYAKHLVPVTNLIHSKARTRVQKFADAFRLRKDE